MLSLEELEARDFMLSEKDGLVLVQPNPMKNLNRSKWKTDELIYRSAVLDKESGQIVSLGFPKFFNYGEGGLSHLENSRLRKDLEAGTVTMTEKLDGSLAIRYVYNGEVRWRTRGTLNDTDFTEAIKKVASEKYPHLNDPWYRQEACLLFEFISPDFRVVIRYPETDLILIGLVWADGHLATDAELDEIAQEYGYRRPKTITFADSNIDSVLASIDEWKGQEGVVARCGKNQQTLLKLKSADYLLRHRLRFSLNTETIRKVCIDNEVLTIADFEKWLELQGADWELIEDARPIVETYIKTNHEALLAFHILEGDVQVNHMKYPDRGDFARNFANNLPITHKGPVFMLLDCILKGDKERHARAWLMFLNNMLDEAFKDVAIKEKTAILLAENE